MEFIITSSSGNSGGGLIYDLLKNRKDFADPFKGNEFRIISDPSGINNIHNSFYDNYSINNSSKSIEEFLNYISGIKKIKSVYTNKKLYDKKFYELTINYIKEITALEYYAMPQFKYVSLSLIKKIQFFIEYKIFSKKVNNIKIFKMITPIDENTFLLKTKKFIENIIKNNLKEDNIKNKKIILDQAINYWRPMDYFKYFDNLKIIIINRDPRSVFYSMKSRNSRAYPGSNIKLFADWYKRIREQQNKFDKNKILEIKYENFIKNFKKEDDKLCNFLKISSNHGNKDIIKKSYKNIYKARNNLSFGELKYIEKKLNKYLNW